MSLDSAAESPESDVTICMSFQDTELTLGLPGGEGRSPPAVSKSSSKRGFVETVDVDLNLRCSTSAGKPPAAKAQMVGWPPLSSSRKKAVTESCKYVKVAADGAPYLRKVNLELYTSYEELLGALEKMFTCMSIRDRHYMDQERKLSDLTKGVMEYVPTYEDKDGDWMLVGDVPWKMFTESCKRIRLMKSSEAAALAAGREMDKQTTP